MVADPPRASSRRRTRTTGSTRSKRLADCAAGRRRRLLDRHAVRSGARGRRRAPRPPRSRARWAIRRRPGSAGAARGGRGVDRPPVRRRGRRRARRRVRRHQGARRRRCRTCCACATRSATPCCIPRSRTRATRWARRSPGCRAVPVAARRRLAPRSRRDHRRRRRARARALGQRAREPDVVGRRRRALRARRGVGPRPRHRRRERRVLRRVRARARDDPRERARRRARDAQPVEALEPRGDARRLLRRRPRARRRTSSRPASTPASWRRRRCRPRRSPRSATTSTSPSSAPATPSGARSRVDALAPLGLVHDGGPCLFYLWLRRDDGADDGWEIAAQLAHDGRACSSRPATSTARPAPTTCGSRSCSRDDRFELALDRLARTHRSDTEEHIVNDLAKQITQLWEAGDDWRDVMPLGAGPRRGALGDRHARPRRGPRRRGRRARSSSTSGRSTRSSCGSACRRCRSSRRARSSTSTSCR